MTTDRKRKCLLICHGATAGGAQNRFCGFTDPPMALSGKKSILDLREKLRNESVKLPKVWYVSDRRRAIETFEIMSAGLYAPVVRLTEGLRELNFGDYENLTWEELPQDFQTLYKDSHADPFLLQFPGGESFNEFCHRVLTSAIDILSFGESDENFGIIGHQGSLQLWDMIVAGLEPSSFFMSPMDYGNCKWLEISANDVLGWRQKYLGVPGKSAFETPGSL